METSRTTETNFDRLPMTGLDRLAVAIATAGGAGFVPVAPGTAGSAVGVGIYVLLLGGGWDGFYLPLLGVMLGVAVWSASRVEGIYGHDSSRIVIDEVVGQMITLGFVARAGVYPILTASILGFLLFRFFDILKPFPVGRLEKMPGGFGVVADDVGAGAYGFLSLVLLEFLIASIG